MTRRVGAVVAVVVGSYVVVVAVVALLQRQLIHLPDTSSPAPPGDVEVVALTTEDGLELSAWFLAADGTPASTILVAPGNAGNRELRLPLARGLVGRGHAVLLLDHRGYGGNPGRPHEEGLVADARAARLHLESRPDVDPAGIVHLGESLGTAVATRLSVDHPPLALVLRSPFPSLVPVGRHHLPFLPVGTLLRDRFATAEHLPDVSAPVLVVAGEDDRTIPTGLSVEVAELAGAVLVTIPGADHNDRSLLDGATYLDAVDRTVRDALGAGGS